MKNPIKRLKQPSQTKDGKRPPLESYARYSNIAFQMFAIIALGVIGGMKLDQWIGLKFPVFTVLLSVLSVFTAIYIVIKDLIKK